jgi:hypothetical protein
MTARATLSLADIAGEIHAILKKESTAKETLVKYSLRTKIDKALEVEAETRQTALRIIENGPTTPLDKALIDYWARMAAASLSGDAQHQQTLLAKFTSIKSAQSQTNTKLSFKQEKKKITEKVISGEISPEMLFETVALMNKTIPSKIEPLLQEVIDVAYTNEKVNQGILRALRLIPISAEIEKLGKALKAKPATPMIWPKTSEEFANSLAKLGAHDIEDFKAAAKQKAIAKVAISDVSGKMVLSNIVSYWRLAAEHPTEPPKYPVSKKWTNDADRLDRLKRTIGNYAIAALTKAEGPGS